MGTMEHQNETRAPYPDAAVRRSWLDRVVSLSQHVAGHSLTAQREEAMTLLTAFADDLPEPSSHFEWLILRSVLLDVAFRFSHALHEPVHNALCAGPACALGAFLECFWPGRPDRVMSDFRRWTVVYLQELDRTHPPTVASRVARFLRGSSSVNCSLRTLAHRFMPRRHESNGHSSASLASRPLSTNEW